MGYTARPLGLPSFDKAVISLWFRIPAETLTAVQALPDDPEDGHYDWNVHYFAPPLFNVIPLLVFGSIEETLPGASIGSGIPISPSFIGVDCAIDDEKAYLAVNLQTATLAGTTPPTGAPELEYTPARFYMSGWGDNDGESLIVQPDQWHHVLISFDISPTSSMTYFNSSLFPDPAFEITPGPTFGWAFDDTSKTGSSMWPCGGERFDLGSQYILPQQLLLMGVAGDHDDVDFTIDVTGCEIVQSGNSIGSPTTEDFADSNYLVQMAELQIFTDVTLDPAVEDNRRAFITSAGRPASPALAAALIGKQPEIYFQTYNDWATGNNRGTAGSYTPTGTITAYEPGP